MTGESGAWPRRYAVIGAGVLGVGLAVRLAEAGGEVTLLDRHCVAFLAEQSHEDVSLINCPVRRPPS